MSAADERLGAALLGLARDAIATRLGGSPTSFLQDSDLPPRLAEPGATFVTLTANGDLRGCIGSLEAHRALRDDVRENALAAAFRDPRFAPVRADELAALRVGVSLLSEAQAFPVADEADACRRLVPQVDGVVLQVGGCRATYLPQVWEQLPDPAVFLAHLKQKAGLPPDFWSGDLRLSRYSVTKWTEPQ